MARRVKVQFREGVALLTIDGAEEGTRGIGFDAPARQALGEALGSALGAPGLRALVLRAGPGGWPLAADPLADYAPEPAASNQSAPSLAALAERLAHAPVPVVAILAGTIGGGALALSQAVGLRLALSSTRFVSPEASLGVLPAAGSLVRMVRRAGPVAALDFVLAGASVQGGAAQGGALQGGAALAAGLCDAVASEGAIETAALTEVLRMAALGAAAPVAPRAGVAENPGPALEALAAARPRWPSAGPLAAVTARLVEVAEAALLLPFEAALAFEEVAYDDLAGTEVSAALCHLAQARRQALGGLAGLGAEAPAQRVASVALWNQPERLAGALLARGLAVRIGASDPARLEATLTAVAQAQEQAVQEGRLTPGRREADWARLEPVAAAASLGPADLCLAAPQQAEELAALRAGFAPGAGGAALALSGVLARPGELGFERMRGPASTIWAGGPGQEGDLRRLAAVLRAEGALVVHGLALNLRLEAAFLAAAERAVLAGATPLQVDEALTGYGFDEGPFALLDRLGLGTALRRLAVAGHGPGPFLDWLMREGRLGQAAGAGVYDHSAEAPAHAPRAMPGEAVALSALREAAGVVGRPLSAGEITGRVLAELAGAGAAALQEGAAHRAGDIDLVAVAALGLARHRGGPMFWADRLGLVAARRRLRDLAEEGAPAPVALWDVLIRNGRRFCELEG